MATRKKRLDPRRRVFVTFGDDLDLLAIEAAKMGLHLATYIRHLIHTHPDRSKNAPSRA